MSIRDMSDEQFYHLMRDLIGSEGGFHAAADNNSEREPDAAPRDNDAGFMVASQG